MGSIAPVPPVPPEGLLTEDIDFFDLTDEANTVRGVLLELLAKKGGVGEPSLNVERICALLDPRRKPCSEKQFVNGSPALKTLAEARFEGDRHVRG